MLAAAFAFLRHTRHCHALLLLLRDTTPDSAADYFRHVIFAAASMLSTRLLLTPLMIFAI